MRMKPIQYADKTKMFHAPGTERLTHYEFRCGYVQQAQRGMQHHPVNLAPLAGVSLTLWMEHGIFHVRAHDFGEHKRLFWESFDTMTKANEHYFRAKRQLALA